MMTPSPAHELCSWKEIAAYLGVSVKAAQLWEQQRGMPVRRLPGPRGQVRAMVTELEAWKSSCPEEAEVVVAPPVPLNWRKGALRWGAVALVAAVTGLVAIFVLMRPVIASVRLETDALVAVDKKGNILWRESFGQLGLQPYQLNEQKVWFGDIDGDGRREILFIPIPASAKPYDKSIPILCLNEAGQEIWRYTASKHIRRGEHEYDNFYIAKQFAIVGKNIILSSHHGLYYPTQIAVLDPKGKLLREYWHPGHLPTILPGTYRGKSVAFLAGVNNLRRMATIVALDPEKLSGSAMEGEQPSFIGMKAGVEEARILLPRSKLFPESPYSVATNLVASNLGLTAHVRENFVVGFEPTITFHFGRDLTITGVTPSDDFRTAFLQTMGHEWSAEEEAALRKIISLPTGLALRSNVDSASRRQ